MIKKPEQKPKEQFTLDLPLIKHEEEGEVIYQRIQDGYVNATAMCKASGKRFKHYNENQTTKDFLQELASEVGIPTSGLVQIIRGGIPSVQGTWVHPQVAINLGQWLSPKFAVKVSQWVFEWMKGDTPRQELPYHLRRYMENMKRIPSGYFSVLQEMTLVLIAPLEDSGYTLPNNIVPDISEGRMFSNWLKGKGIDTSKMPTYKHKYEDGRIVDAKMYPAKYLNEFRLHVSEEWLPKRAIPYFKPRDETALPHLQKILQLNADIKREQLENG